MNRTNNVEAKSWTYTWKDDAAYRDTSTQAFLEPIAIGCNPIVQGMVSDLTLLWQERACIGLTKQIRFRIRYIGRYICRYLVTC